MLQNLHFRILDFHRHPPFFYNKVRFTIRPQVTRYNQYFRAKRIRHKGSYWYVDNGNRVSSMTSYNASSSINTISVFLSPIYFPAVSMGCFNLVEQYCLQRRKFLETCHTVLKLIFAQWILWPNGGLRQSHTPSNNFRNYGRASNGFPNNFFCLVIHDALGGCFVHRAPSGYFCWRIYHVASAILNSPDQVGSSHNEPPSI